MFPTQIRSSLIVFFDEESVSRSCSQKWYGYFLCYQVDQVLQVHMILIGLTTYRIQFWNGYTCNSGSAAARSLCVQEYRSYRWRILSMLLVNKSTLKTYLNLQRSAQNASKIYLKLQSKNCTSNVSMLKRADTLSHRLPQEFSPLFFCLF